MQVKRPAGRHASVVKYDILTALGAFALSQPKTPQKLVLRFMTLVTARYNWSRNELAIGQREIARLWCVDERTVKREMAKLRAMGWLVVKKQGVRGRVTEHGINLDRIHEDTRISWENVGPDFEQRMNADEDAQTNVVPLRTGQIADAPDLSDGKEWSLAKAVLHRENPAIYTAWIEALSRSDRAGGRLTLTAPSQFHASYVLSHLKPRLLAACQDIDPSISELLVLG
jgi:DNA-binding MarR family transcriptional regulator